MSRLYDDPQREARLREGLQRLQERREYLTLFALGWLVAERLLARRGKRRR